MNGFVVKAGCQLLAYQDKAQMVLDMTAYIDDPDAAEKAIIERWGKTGTYRHSVIPGTEPMQTPVTPESMGLMNHGPIATQQAGNVDSPLR